MRIRKFTLYLLALVLTAGIFASAGAGFADGAAVEASGAEIVGTDSQYDDIIIDAASTKVSTPYASVKSGTYEIDSYKKVTLKCETKGATIWYSLNGAAYKKYTTALKLKKNSTLTVYASKNGKKSSSAEYNYKLKEKASVSLKEGTYTGSRTVKITSKYSKAKIYYTTNGKKPTTKSKKYSGELTLTESCTLRILVKRTGCTSNYYSYDYVIIPESGSTADPGTSTGGTDTSGGLDDKILYGLLDADGKKAYAAMYDALLNFKDSVDVSECGITVDECKKIYYYLIADCPELYYVHDGRMQYSYSGSQALDIYFFFVNTESEVRSRTPKLEAAADKIIAAAPCTKKDLFNYVLYLHDTVCGKVTYTFDTNDEIRDMAGTDDALLDGKGLCVAYARAFEYLCQRSGIDCIMVTGDGYSDNSWGGHAWNKIYLDGDWYVIDTCWDDTTYNTPRYTYFCVTDSGISRDHSLDAHFKVDALSATATEYSYYNQMGITVYGSLNDAYEGLKAAVRENAQKGICRTEIYCANEAMCRALHGDAPRAVENALSGVLSGYSYSYGYNGTMYYVEIIP